MQEESKFCKCMQKGKGRRLAFRLVGKCPKDRGQECFKRYTQIRTETYYNHAGQKSITRENHPEDRKDSTFAYKCDGTAWGLADSTDPQLPTILEGRGQDEQDAFAAVMKKFAENGKGGLSQDEIDMLDIISGEDRDQLIEEMKDADDDFERRIITRISMEALMEG